MKTRSFLIFFLLLAAARLTAQPAGETRALWVTRWEYSTADDIARICRNAAAANFNVLLFQVRGNGTVCYPSQYEPWAREIGGRHPGFDPLAVAIEKAHENGLELHAWINVYPGWRGDLAPADPSQLYNQHRDWFMRSRFGRLQPLQKGYVWLSPTHPRVQDYLLKICKEIYTDYEIDGLHLDYIRYPGSEYSWDEASVDIFQNRFRAAPEEKPRSWMVWRQMAITGFLERLYPAFKEVRPGAPLTASVIADVQRGRNIFFQDSHGWLARGVIDAIYPMIYTSDMALFERQLNEHLANSHNRHVYPGISIQFGDMTTQISKIRDMGAPGFAVFSYDMVFPHHQPSDIWQPVLDETMAESMSAVTLPWTNQVGDRQGPVITQVKTVPKMVQPNLEFRIAAKITDPSGVYDDRSGSDGQGVYLVYSRDWPPDNGAEIRMSRIRKTQDWYMTDEPIPAQSEGLDFRCRIYAHDNYHLSANHPRRNRGYSDVYSISILNPHESFVADREIGPELWNPNAMIIDDRDQLWISTGDVSPLTIMTRGGTVTDFSPIRFGINDKGARVEMDNIVGLAAVDSNTICVANNGANPMLFFLDARTGAPRRGLFTGFEMGEIAADGSGHLYVLEANRTRWHVLNTDGEELDGSPFGGGKTGVDIAVLNNGALVLVSERTTERVQCWQGAIENNRARYWRVDDLPTVDTGLGKVAVDGDQSLYVANDKRGVITIFNPLGKPIDYLTQHSTLLQTPREAAVTADRQTLFIMELAGIGPTRIKRWIKSK